MISECVEAVSRHHPRKQRLGRNVSSTRGSTAPSSYTMLMSRSNRQQKIQCTRSVTMWHLTATGGTSNPIMTKNHNPYHLLYQPSPSLTFLNPYIHTAFPICWPLAPEETSHRRENPPPKKLQIVWVAEVVAGWPDQWSTFCFCYDYYGGSIRSSDASFRLCFRWWWLGWMLWWFFVIWHRVRNAWDDVGRWECFYVLRLALLLLFEA